MKRWMLGVALLFVSAMGRADMINATPGPSSSSGGGSSGVTLSSFSATQPIVYNNATGAFSATLISATTGIVGIVPDANLPTDIPFTDSTATITAVRVFTSSIAVNSGLYLGSPTTVVSTYTITSTDTVVLFNCAVTGCGGNLPTAASSRGQVLTLSKVDATTGPVIVSASGTDVICGSNTWVANAPGQSASVMSDGVSRWIPVGQGCQITPERLYPLPYQQARNFVVSVSSDEVTCPLYAPVPVCIMGYAFDGVTAGGANISIGVLDSPGTGVVDSTGPVALAASLVALTRTVPTCIPMGSYNLAAQLTNTTGKITGSDSANSGIAGCSRVAKSSVGISAVTLPGTAPGSTPGISVLIAGKRQTYQ